MLPFIADDGDSRVNLRVNSRWTFVGGELARNFCAVAKRAALSSTRKKHCDPGALQGVLKYELRVESDYHDCRG